MASSSSGPVAGSTAGRGFFPGLTPSSAPRPATGDWVFGSRAETLVKYATLAGRVLLSQIFLISGFMKIVDWSGTEAKMAEQGMFWIPFFHVAAMLVELVAGLAL